MTDETVPVAQFKLEWWRDRRTGRLRWRVTPIWTVARPDPVPAQVQPKPRVAHVTRESFTKGRKVKRRLD